MGLDPTEPSVNQQIVPLNFRELTKTYKKDINFHRCECSKNKAILSFKYDELTFKVNFIQILVIILSTTMTFIESMKPYIMFGENAVSMLTIIFSTTIALVVSINKYLKMDEQKELVRQSLDNHVFIINKFRRTYNALDNFERKNEDALVWSKIVNNYENEIFSNYINIRENFDSLISFKESIYYKNRYKKQLLRLELTNNEISLINQFKSTEKAIPHEFLKPISNLKRWLCCIKERESVDYEKFMLNLYSKSSPKPDDAQADQLFNTQTFSDNDPNIQPLINDESGFYDSGQQEREDMYVRSAPANAGQDYDVYARSSVNVDLNLERAHAENEKLRAHNRALISENRSLQRELGRFGRDNAALETKILDLEDENYALREKIGRLDAEFTRQMEEVNKLNRELTEQIERTTSV